VERKRTRWRPLLLLLLPAALLPLLLCGAGGWVAYRWLNRPREPVGVEVIAAYPGASAEEVEAHVTVPLEVGLAGLPGLEAVRSRSSLRRCELRLEFGPRTDRHAARQEVLNRLQLAAAMPAGVTPQLSPALPRDAVLRLTVAGPGGADGRPVYAARDLTALRDVVVRRELLRVPGVAEVEGVGGEVKCYEVQPDPDRLKRYGVRLGQLERALAAGNAGLGPVLGGGNDPLLPARSAKSPPEAAAHLRAEEQRRLRDLRRLVVATANGVPVRVEDVTDSGPQGEGGGRGVLVGRREPVGPPADGDAVQAVVLARPGEDREAVLRGARTRIEELNGTPGKLLPGTRIEIAAEGAGAGGPDDFPEAFEAPADGGLVKVFGPDLGGLAQAGEAVRQQLAAVPGVAAVRVIPGTGKARLSLEVDRQKCARWGVAVADVMAVLSAARDGITCAQGAEGGEVCDVVLRWPQRCRQGEEAILNLPVDTANEGGRAAPRLRLRDVAAPRDAGAGAVAIYRENGERLIAVRFRGDAKAVAAARQAVAVPAPYRAEWGGR
jgi:Cu/Ag efflux pump CusA